MAFIARPRCKVCNGRLYHAAKSHRHYTHLTKTDCAVQRVEDGQLWMERVELPEPKPKKGRRKGKNSV
jgi:hypothetical protein